MTKAEFESVCEMAGHVLKTKPHLRVRLHLENGKTFVGEDVPRCHDAFAGWSTIAPSVAVYVALSHIAAVEVFDGSAD